MLIGITQIPGFSIKSSQIQSSINTFCVYIISLIMSNKLQALVSFTQTFLKFAYLKSN